MSFDARHVVVEQTPSPGLSVYQCGWQQCHASHVCGLGLRNHFVLHHILSGTGRYYAGQHTYTLGPGDGFLIMPFQVICYEADAADPWQYIFVAFDGTDVLPLLRAAGLDASRLTYHLDHDADLRRHLNQALEAGRANLARGYDVIGHFELAMACLIRHNGQGNRRLLSQEQYLGEAQRVISTNYPYELTISEIARTVGIDRTYLYRLFRQQLGCSPQRWLIRYRMQRAMQLIEQTDLSLTAIAHSVGYHDLAPFSRAFKSVYGISPQHQKMRRNQVHAD
jgi:AraC-like DNA-binding protein